MPRLARWIPHVSLLSVVTIAFTMLPVQPALAGRTEDRLVNDLIPEFDQGKLLRTSVTPDKTSNVANDGGIALSPVGYIDNWQQSAFTLPERVSDMGAVTVNGRIYLLGGTVYNPTTTQKAPTAHAWVGTPGSDGNLVDPPGGTPAWQAQPDLPVPPLSCVQTTTATAARSSVAAAGFSTGTGGFIYAVGGAVAPTSGDPYSSSAIAIGAVDANGTVTWRSPEEMCLPTKLQATSATIIEIQGEKYLYVVGGLSRQPPRGPIPLTQEGVKTTFVARINANTGDLSKISDGTPGWDTGFDLPVPDIDPNREEGVWNATLVPASSDFNGTTYFALFLMGGETVPGTSTPSDSAIVYRGIIDTTTKTVAWNIDIGNGTFNAALNQSRRGLRAVVYDGSNIIVTGGTQGSGTSSAFSSVLSNQLDEKLELPVFGDGTVNFFESPSVLPEGRGRYNHGSVVVTVGTDKYVYVLGGVGNSSAGEGDQTDTVFYGKIATDPNDSAGYAQNGWYYSNTYTVDIDKAKLLAVRWQTTIDRSAGDMDIQIEYRVNNNANKLDESWSEWFPATDPNAGSNRSINGQNSSTLPQGLSFIYFEYRAFFKTYRPSNGAWKTPVLRNLGIQIEVPGYPNLKIPTAQKITVDDLLRGIEVTVANKDPLPVGDPLQPADDGSNGQFFVDVYIFKPGENAQPPILGQVGQVYAKLNKRDFPPNASHAVRNWLDGSPGAGNAEYDITKQFTVAGTYTIYAMVDSVDSGTLAQNPFGLVQEADIAGQQGEGDNIYGPLTVDVPVPCPPEGCGLPPSAAPPIILLPVVAKN